MILLEELLLVEGDDLAGLSDAERIHLMVEAKKLAFLDRNEILASWPSRRPGLNLQLKLLEPTREFEKLLPVYPIALKVFHRLLAGLGFSQSHQMKASFWPLFRCRRRR